MDLLMLKVILVLRTPEVERRVWAAVECESPGCSLPSTGSFKCQMWLHSPPVFTQAFLPSLNTVARTQRKGSVGSAALVR